MINKVYLLWNAYTTDELLVIASLYKIDKNYCFKYENDAIKAIQLGCMLPFSYTDKELYFTSLPHFFTQRMLRNDMLQKLNIKYNPNDELSILTSNDGRRNNDNFYIVTEERLNNLKENTKVMK